MKTVLITGANRGLGLAFVEQYLQQGCQVLATARDLKKAAALQALAEEHSSLRLYQLDVNDDNSISQLKDELGDTPIDYLINNAGTSGERGVTIGNIDKENFLNVFATNCYAVVKLSDTLLPLIEKSTEKLIVVISSRMGSISDNERGASYAYRTSKSALNCAMRSFAIDVEDKDVKVLLLHPGWVKTDMGGDNAPVTSEESVLKMREQIEMHKANAHAEVLRRYDGGTIAW